MSLRMRYCVSSLAAIGLLVGLTTWNARAWNFAPPNSVSGEAFGISVNAAGVRVGPTPHVVLPPDGGMVRDKLLNITVPNVGHRPHWESSRPDRSGPTPTAAKAAPRWSRRTSSTAW